MQLVHDPIVDSLKGLEIFRVGGPDDKTIRVAFAPVKKGKKLLGSVIISPGRTEYIEKHATTAVDLTQRGYNVLIVDQRGQGWSDRLTANPMAGHMDDFKKAAVHLGLAIDAAQDRLKGPHLLLCHSMGGCIGLEAILSGHATSVIGAAFSAPMWGLNVPVYARPMTKVTMGLGGAEKIAPTTPKTWKPEPFEGNAITHDPAQFARNNALFLAEPALQIGGPTNGWISGAFATMDAFTPDRLKDVSIPMLVVSGEADAVVDNAAHVRIAGQIPNTILRVVQGAKHELLHERKDLRDQFWTHFDTWSSGVLA